MRRRFAVWAPLLVGCSGAAVARAPSATTDPPRVVPTVEAEATYPVMVGRAPLSEPRAVTLGTNIEPVLGDESVVFVSQFASEPLTYLTRVSTNEAGVSQATKVFVLEGEYFVSAVRFGDGIHHVTMRGREVCVHRERPDMLERLGCAPLEGEVLVPSEEGFTLVETVIDTEDAAPKPKRKANKKKPKRKRPEEVLVKPAPRKVSLRLTPLSKALVAEEPLTSDLTWKSPMPGMDLIAAARGRNDRIRVAFYELEEGSEKKPLAIPGAIGRGKVSIVSLESDAMVDLSSRHALSTSELLFGSLATHEAPRFVSSERGILYFDQMSTRGKCAAVVASPFYMPMVPDQDACLFHPERFFDVGTAVREKLPAPPKPSVPSRLGDARRAYGQGPSDPLRVTGFGASKYTRIGDEAVVLRKGELSAIEPFPLVAKRSRVLHVAWTSDGVALAHTDTGLVAFTPGETPRALGEIHPRGLGDEERRDVFGARSFAARVGDVWFQSRGELSRLSTNEKPAIRALSMDEAVVTGGKAQGALISLASGRLSVHSLDSEGVLSARGSIPSPVASGFDATERPGGGAIIVGKERTKESFVAFALDDRGMWGPVSRFPALGKSFLLTPLANGAIASDEVRVVWLDVDGRVLASKERPTDRVEAHCVDGKPSFKWVPSDRAGIFVSAPTLAKPGTCVLGEAVVRGGILGWVGATTSGASSFAVGGSERIPEASRPDPGATKPVTFAPLEAPSASRCPAEMVFVPPSLCVDRFEGALADAKTMRFLSPDVPSTPNLFAIAMGDFATKRETMGDLYARAFPMPRVPAWQMGQAVEVRVESRADVRPSGYVTGIVARAACEASRKRLCKLDEWKRACRGQTDQPFPYGAQYVDAVCNVNGPIHPAAVLHGHSSLGHLDPRLNRVPSGSGTVLHRTGANPACASTWENDAIFDMVGNLDEWVDVKGGAFAGGFYARGTKSGCDALVDNHPQSYLDYSTGVRCCRDADP